MCGDALPNSQRGVKRALQKRNWSGVRRKQKLAELTDEAHVQRTSCCVFCSLKMQCSALLLLPSDAGWAIAIARAIAAERATSEEQKRIELKHAVRFAKRNCVESVVAVGAGAGGSGGAGAGGGDGDGGGGGGGGGGDGGGGGGDGDDSGGCCVGGRREAGGVKGREGMDGEGRRGLTRTRCGVIVRTRGAKPAPCGSLCVY